METECQEITDPIVKEIRKCEGYENISEEEALQIALLLKEFSTLCYTAFERM